MIRHRTVCGSIALIASLTLAGCGTEGESAAAEITLENCGEDETFPSPAKRIYVYDGGMIAMILQLQAHGQVAGVAGMGREREVLAKIYGEEVVGALPVATDSYPTLENVIATDPDLMIAGWNYGFSEARNLVPDDVSKRGIAPYLLTESCRSGASDDRGIVPPWDALRTDMRNLGAITGKEDNAAAYLTDLDQRLDNLADAEQASEPPTVFLFDSGTKDVFSSGNFGGPEAIITAAGGVNALTDLDDTWTRVSWERVAASQPDAIAFVDYPGQTYEQKVAVLEANPATRDLQAVKLKRYLNLPYAAWVSSPLNIDAAEQLRSSLQDWDLVPASEIAPSLDLVPE